MEYLCLEIFILNLFPADLEVIEDNDVKIATVIIGEERSC